jgi:hypothetical protein
MGELGVVPRVRGRLGRERSEAESGKNQGRRSYHALLAGHIEFSTVLWGFSRCGGGLHDPGRIAFGSFVGTSRATNQRCYFIIAMLAISATIKS